MSIVLKNIRLEGDHSSVLCVDPDRERFSDCEFRNLKIRMSRKEDSIFVCCSFNHCDIDAATRASMIDCFIEFDPASSAS